MHKQRQPFGCHNRFCIVLTETEKNFLIFKLISFKFNKVIRTSSMGTMLLTISKAVLLCHCLAFTIAGHHDYQCVERSPQLNVCVLTTPTCNTRLNVTCGDRHLDIRTVDSTVDRISSGEDLPPLNEAWTRCRHGPTEDQPDTSPTVTEVKLSDHFVSSLPDQYFCNLQMERLVIFGNSLSDTRKIGLSPVDNCDKPCLTKVHTLQAEQNVFGTVFSHSFCGLDTLVKLHLRYSEINELEIDAFVHLKSLQTLDLKNNLISNLPIGVFRHQHNTLIHLDMSNNQLDGQSMLELRDLKNLESLNLQGNRIDALPEGFFDEMNQLRDLKMGNNLLTSFIIDLTSSTNLESLDLKSNDISIIKIDFENQSKIKNINVQNNPINSLDIGSHTKSLNRINLSNISLSYIPQFISKAKKVKWVYLTKNNIGRIDAGTFDAGEDIELIDLSYNRLTDITEIFINCTVKQLYLNHNRITQFAFNDFSPQLKVLSMTHNHIHAIDAMATVDNRWTLKTLNLSNNLFNELKDLSLPASVANFYIKNNNISFISYSDSYIKLTNDNQTSLKQMHLEHNAFRVICPKFILPKNQPLEYYFNGNPLLCACENRWLSSTNVDLLESVVEDRNKLTCQSEFQRTAKQPQLISRLNNPDIYCSFSNDCPCAISRVACNVKCPQQCQCHKPFHSNIIYMDCSSSDIKLPLTTSAKFNKGRELHVYLDNNSIYNIDSSSLLGLNNTIELYLNWTNLVEIQDGSFDHLSVLSILHLDHNNLRHISDNIFKRLSSLTQLFLSHNQLQTVEPNAFPSQLQTLHLDNNQLVDLSFWQLEDLSNVKTLDLRANKWSCECNNTEDFRKWLHKFVDTKEVNCVQANGVEQSLIDFDSQYCSNTTVNTNVNTDDDDDVWQLLFGYFTD